MEQVDTTVCVKQHVIMYQEQVQYNCCKLSQHEFTSSLILILGHPSTVSSCVTSEASSASAAAGVISASLLASPWL